MDKSTKTGGIIGAIIGFIIGLLASLSIAGGKHIKNKIDEASPGAAIEQEVQMKLMSSECYRLFIQELLIIFGNSSSESVDPDLQRKAMENQWVKNQYNYYDDCRRCIFVGDDVIGISWPQGEREGVSQPILYSFTASGYLPLHDYKVDGKVRMNQTNIRRMWCTIIRDGLKAIEPSLVFDNTGKSDSENKQYSFNYRVPQNEYKDWI